MTYRRFRPSFPAGPGYGGAAPLRRGDDDKVEAGIGERGPRPAEALENPVHPPLEIVPSAVHAGSVEYPASDGKDEFAGKPTALPHEAAPTCPICDGNAELVRNAMTFRPWAVEHRGRAPYAHLIVLEADTAETALVSWVEFCGGNA